MPGVICLVMVRRHPPAGEERPKPLSVERGRLSHVDQTYMSPETYTAANPYLVEHQAGIAYAQALGGGLVADVDRMRFVVPTRATVRT